MVQGGGDGKIGGSRRRGRAFFYIAVSFALHLVLRCSFFCIAVSVALQFVLRCSFFCIAACVALQFCLRCS